MNYVFWRFKKRVIFCSYNFIPLIKKFATEAFPGILSYMVVRSVTGFAFFMMYQVAVTGVDLIFLRTAFSFQMLVRRVIQMEKVMPKIKNNGNNDQ